MLVLAVHLGRSGDLVIQTIYIGLQWRWRVGGLSDRSICPFWGHTGFVNGPLIQDVGMNKKRTSFGTKRLTALPRYFARRESWSNDRRP